MRNTLSKTKSTLPNTIQWNHLNWLHINRYVEKLQQRIYRAESLGNNRKVRELQRLLMRSKSALLVSIKRITQMNKGKKTAGVDGYTALSDTERTKLYQQMKDYDINAHNPKPSYRSYIKKKNGKLRPLNIPTIKDRVWQNVAKIAMEPQWEYRFEPTSYGFRPCRGCHDAIDKIFKSLVHRKNRWVYEGDFKGCFDNLRHDYIMEQIRNFPNKGVIEKWLKAGYIDSNIFSKTEYGSGQGSVISPLLANIALHGMEEQLGIEYAVRTRKDGYKVVINKSDYTMTRYADDFVVMCRTKEQAESISKKLHPYFNSRGLELEPTKTRVVEVTEGFDFLGFNIRMYQTSQGEKLLIKPSKEAIRKCRKKITEETRHLYGSNVEALISKLNPILRGISNYWSPEVSKWAFNQMDRHVFYVTYRFLKKMHRKKANKWIRQRYYRKDYRNISKDKWILSSPNMKKLQLIKMSWTPIKRHRMICYKATPYDSNLEEYFDKRENRLDDQIYGEQVCLSCMS